MSQNTKLKRKVLRTLLAMSLVYSGGIFAAENLASAATITTPQHFGKDSAYSHSDYECNGVTYKSAQVFLCQVGTKKFLRFYKPFIGG